MKKLFISSSNISGTGLFAGKKILKGEVIFVMRGRIVSFHPRNKRDAMMFPNRVGIGKDLWMEPDMEFVRFINHSCNPNSGIRGKFTFCALRDIEAGEEITFDYSISEDSQWELRCFCGEKNCRGIIRGIRYLPRDVFLSYLPFIPKYFQDVYSSVHDILPVRNSSGILQNFFILIAHLFFGIKTGILRILKILRLC